ncbi:MAG: 50S ribosomal protein L3 [Pseudomonadota bacterium]
MPMGLLGRKLGITQVNDQEGNRIAVTLIEAGPCLVVQKKTVEKDGYAALKLGFGAKKATRTTKALRGVYAKIKAEPRRLQKEFRIPSEDLGKYEEGKEIRVDEIFTLGQIIDVKGRTKGHGFSGVIKRHHMKGNDAGHGTHEFFRHGGSIGTRTWPGYVNKNKRMPGHDGDKRITMPNLTVIQILADKNCILVSGAVPGANNAFVEILPSATRKPKAKPAN